MSRTKPVGSRTWLHLVRHGSAGHRDNSNPYDSDRKLDGKGHRQAERLVQQLAGHQLLTVVSSPLIRCVQTVEPLAAANGLGVTVNPAFAEMMPVDRAWRALEDLALALDSAVATPPDIDRPLAAVVCSHGDMIPDLLRTAVMRGTRVLGPSGWAKGSIWSLTGWDGVTFATASYTPQKEFSAEGPTRD